MPFIFRFSQINNHIHSNNYQYAANLRHEHYPRKHLDQLGLQMTREQESDCRGLWMPRMGSEATGRQRMHVWGLQLAAQPCCARLAGLISLVLFLSLHHTVLAILEDSQNRRLYFYIEILYPNPSRYYELIYKNNRKGEGYRKLVVSYLKI